jgi:antibiotic biosynthesis monooxygenase (ABM) superfamily enzyme
MNVIVVTQKIVFLTKMDGYQKMSDTNRNVTKIGVIIKGVYYITTKTFTIYLRLKFDFWDLNVSRLFISFSQGKLDGLALFYLFFNFVMLFKW